MYDWLLHNALFVLLILCAAVITLGLIVTALTKVRAEFSRLRDEIKELSEQVKALEVAEQRRFLKELKPHSERSESSHSTNVRLLKSETEPEALAP
jgi:uncharacterized membrane protein (DUF106 family)